MAATATSSNIKARDNVMWSKRGWWWQSVSHGSCPSSPVPATLLRDPSPVPGELSGSWSSGGVTQATWGPST